MTYKRDALFWKEECIYISIVTGLKGDVSEMNHDLGTFIRYCEMMRNTAERDGFFDAVTYISECLDDLADLPVSDSKPART